MLPVELADTRGLKVGVARDERAGEALEGNVFPSVEINAHETYVCASRASAGPAENIEIIPVRDVPRRRSTSLDGRSVNRGNTAAPTLQFILLYDISSPAAEPTPRD